MLSHLMEALLLVLIASSRNVESSSTGVVAGNNGKKNILSSPATADKRHENIYAKNFCRFLEPRRFLLSRIICN